MLFIYCVLHDDTGPDSIVCGFPVGHILKTLFYRLVPLGLGGLGNRSPSRDAMRPKMASRIRGEVTLCTELAVEKLLPMIIPLFFM